MNQVVADVILPHDRAWVLENIKPEWTLSRITGRYFGHVLREKHAMKNDAMLRGMSGREDQEQDG